MAHGSPIDVNEYVLEDTDENYVLGLMKNADILCVGHSHKPYHRIIQSALENTKHVINIGSVGKPKDGNQNGCSVLLTITETGSPAVNESIKVDFVRFPYDVEKTARDIENSILDK